MKRPVMVMMLLAGLLMVAAPYGRAFPFGDTSKTSDPAAAKEAEEKGDLARAHNSYVMAVLYYQAAIHADRQNPNLYNKLGIVQLQLRERGLARKNFQQALKYAPKNAPAINNLGAVALLNKKFKSAIGYFKQALALDESAAATHVNLAEAWLGLGETDRAMTEYAWNPGAAEHAGTARPHRLPDCQILHEARQHRRSFGLSEQGQGAALSRLGQGLLRPGFRSPLEGPPSGQDRQTVDDLLFVARSAALHRGEARWSAAGKTDSVILTRKKNSAER
jgi:tetratricopeptide (TPR) repeat protein